MSDVDFAQSDEAFEAEVSAAREAEAMEPEAVEETQEPAPDPDREKLEKVARDKDGMARSERQKRREAERQIEELKAQLAAKETKADPFAALNEIDEDADPIGAIKAFKGVLTTEAQTRQEQAAQQKQQEQLQAIGSRVAEFETDFKAENPDYDAAVAHFRESRRAELEDTGYSGPELQQALLNDMLGLALRSMKSGKDPAEVVYNLAKKRGFGVEITPPVDKAENKLQAVERGLTASKSLSSVAKAGDGELTIEAINKLDGAAFDAALAKFKAQQRRAA